MQNTDAAKLMRLLRGQNVRGPEYKGNFAQKNPQNPSEFWGLSLFLTEAGVASI